MGGHPASMADGALPSQWTMVSEPQWVYQVTEKGLAAEVGLKGTKYYKDKALNEGLGK